MIGHVIEADHAYAREIGVRLPEPSLADRAAVEAERAAVLDALRQPSDGSPLADRKWTAALRRPPDRLARPRPRLGDGGPHRRRDRRPRAHAAIPAGRPWPLPSRTSSRRSGRRRAARARRCRPPTSRACGRPGRRISGWCRNVGGRSPTQQPPEPDLGRRRVDQVAAADDEVDVLAQVIDDDAEAVGPVAVAIADRQVAGRRRRRPEHGPTAASIHVSRPAPIAARSAGPSSAALATAARDSPVPTTAGRSPPPTPRTSSACNRSRTAARPPGAAPAPPRRPAPRRDRTGASARDRPRTPAMPGPRSAAASYSGRDRTRS